MIKTMGAEVFIFMAAKEFCFKETGELGWEKKRMRLTGIHTRTKLGLKCANVDIMSVWLRIRKKEWRKTQKRVWFWWCVGKASINVFSFKGINRFICSVVLTMLFWCTNRTLNYSVCHICALTPLTSILLPSRAIETLPHQAACDPPMLSEAVNPQLLIFKIFVSHLFYRIWSLAWHPWKWSPGNKSTLSDGERAAII